MREVAEAFASSRGRYGYRRVRAVLRTRVSEKALRRIMAEDGPTAHVPERRGYGSYEGETTPAPGDLADRDFTAEMPNEKWLTDITEIKARDGKVSLSPPIDCYDGKIVAYTAGPGPNAELANRMLVKAMETLPEGARPLVHSDRGCHCRRPGWLALMDRYGPARSTGAKGRSPDDAAAEGFLGRMRTEPVYPGHWGGGAYPRRGARPDRRLHPLARPRAHQTVDWLDESGTIPSEPGNGCVIISKKTSAAPLSHLSHIHVDKAQYYIQV